MIGPFQVLPLWARVDLGAMAKLQDYWNLTIRLFSVISKSLAVGRSYPSADVQLVYWTAPVDWATCINVICALIKVAISPHKSIVFWNLCSPTLELQKVPVRISRLTIVVYNIIGTFWKANNGYWYHYWNNLEKHCDNVVCMFIFSTHENE